MNLYIFFTMLFFALVIALLFAYTDILGNYYDYITRKIKMIWFNFRVKNNRLTIDELMESHYQSVELSAKTFISNFIERKNDYRYIVADNDYSVIKPFTAVIDDVLFNYNRHLDMINITLIYDHKIVACYNMVNIKSFGNNVTNDLITAVIETENDDLEFTFYFGNELEEIDNRIYGMSFKITPL